MKRKNYVAGLLFLSFFSANCFAAQVYLGVTGGLGIVDGRYRAHAAVTDDTHKATVGGTSALLGGVIGVEHTFTNNLYSAIELNGLYDSYDQLVRLSTNAVGVSNHRVNIKNNFLYGAGVKVGASLNGTIPYIIAGIEGGQWTMNLRNNSAVNVRGIDGFSSTNYNKTLFGPKLGVGVRLPLYKNISADMQYAYTWYGNISKNLVDSTAITWNHKVQIQQHSVLFALNYAFC